MAVSLSAKFHEAEEGFRRAATTEEQVGCLHAMRAELDVCIQFAETDLLPPVSPLYRAAWETYLRDLPQMLRERRGQAVAYRGEKCLGFANDDLDLYEQCRRDGIPDDEFNVFLIEPIPEYDTIGCGAWVQTEESRP
jgi:hypothetical protein